MSQDSEIVEFRQGQVWLSPKGTWYRVEEVRLGQATLRVGLQGTGRLVRRPVAATQGWQFVAPLVTGELIQQVMGGKF